MTPVKLVLFRMFLILFGRIPQTGIFVHRILVWIYIKKNRRPYGASSRFFTPEDLR